MNMNQTPVTNKGTKNDILKEGNTFKYKENAMISIVFMSLNI